MIASLELYFWAHFTGPGASVHHSFLSLNVKLNRAVFKLTSTR